MNAHSDHNEIAVIVNGSAGCGNGTDKLTEIEAQLRAAGCTAGPTLASADETQEAVEKAVQGDAKIIAVGGGDRTRGLVAAFLAGHNIVLGILPMGT